MRGGLEIIWSWFTPEPNAMKNVKERSKAFYLSNCVPFCVTISGIHEIFVSSPNWCLTEACAQCNTVKMFSLGEWQTEGEDILNVKETTTRFKKFHFSSCYMSVQTVSTRKSLIRDIYQLSNPRGPLLNSLSEIAAIPPYVPHNQHCGAAPLPR